MKNYRRRGYPENKI